MVEIAGRASPIDAYPAWTIVTDAPLKGIGLAREAGRVLTWDEGDSVALYDLDGERLATARAPGKIVAGVISDDGSLVALAGDHGQLWLLARDLELVAERPHAPDCGALAVDPHGRFVASASKTNNRTQITARHGRPAGQFETRQPLAHLTFLPSRPILLGASGYGTIVGVDLSPSGSGATLRADVAWQSSLMTNVGRLAASGDGGIILASCFNYGIQRFDLNGDNEGSYHLGGTTAHAVPDFAARLIVVATLEGELSALNQAGNVRWKSSAPRPAMALEVDALGRFFLYGMATGEVTRVELGTGSGTSGGRGASVALAPSRTPVGGSVRRADWQAPVAESDDQAATSVLAVLDDPPAVGVITSRNRLRVFLADGRELPGAPELSGVGRILRVGSGRIVAATDRMIGLYDVRRGVGSRLEIPLAEVTHLAVLPGDGGLAVVQERDRLGVARGDSTWAWKVELNSAVEEMAAGPDGSLAVTTEDGALRLYGPDGTPAAPPPTGPAEPLSVIEAPEGSPADLVWITLARRLQVLRGHRADGRTLWQAPVPWESWQLHRVGSRVVVSAPDGRAIAFDSAGKVVAQGRDGNPSVTFCPGPAGAVWRVAAQGVHLGCTDLAGSVQWRVVADAAVGPIAAGRSGAAALLGRQLAWVGAKRPVSELPRPPGPTVS